MDDAAGIFGAAMRQVPHDSVAEQAVLGAILTNNRAFAAVEDILEPEHFYDPLLGRVFGLCRDLIYRGEAANPISLRRHLDSQPDLGRQTAQDLLAGLLTSMISVLDAASYARAIRDAWVRRSLFDVCTRAADRACRPGSTPVGDIVDELEDGLLQMSMGMSEDAPLMSAGAAVGEALRSAREAAARGTGLAGVSWGYRALDRMTGGLMPGCVYLLGARPAMGKSSIALGIAARVAAGGVPTYFWSGEMKESQLGARLGAAHARLSTQAVFTGRRYDVPEHAETGMREELSDWQWRDLEDGERAAGALPLWFDSRARITATKMRARARRMKRSRTGLGLIVVDYVGLMSAGSAFEDQRSYERITKISGQMKQLAVELDVPLVLLAQLNRQSEGREDKRPTMADFRDAGALEQDADVILLLHREHYYLEKQLAAGLTRRERESAEDFANRVSDLNSRVQKAEGKADLEVAKQRQGPVGVCHLRFTNETTWFRDEAEDQYSPAWINTAEGRAHGQSG
ncbi:prophage replicative DNA helicase DnaB [Ameyamaea chiangmaiensis NBRC 103196]|uniref:DNA 5'-3' helicase n=1 Tax=Ameyamaea chiangmaiensis TaxID=442969 RepID=A0A850P2X1_9PROT|nr:DnaB-like helicase C-terminal domain-containing protein [Ameyamaea chiangmaiensis]MBS4075453.1 AAA family ATPase [Ameyamaea chiangmaiensis]NVN39015.1 AAA family ATPase [Ameyamaea chiangmaiensis]GBQ69708.1 prophage replicative DNA helicase DnaB [Ameyamaea chiangmaiensis NBRC 103196]